MKELVVISPLNDWTCRECQGTGELLVMEGPGPLCLACAELDHLVFLGRGDAALTRRAKAATKLWAVVIRFSRERKRYERQGLLIEETALKKAEAECLADAEMRARRKVRETERRAAKDEALARSTADGIRRLFPGCPPEEAEAIARYATVRKSGRVGRTAAAKEMEERPLILAVVAAVRHGHTQYDELLMSGMDRIEAREAVGGEVDRILAGWRSGKELIIWRCPVSNRRLGVPVSPPLRSRPARTVVCGHRRYRASSGGSEARLATLSAIAVSIRPA